MATSRIDHSLLYPPFNARLQKLIANLGPEWFVTSGLRTMAEQKILWCQGRTLPGKIVTNAKPGQSLHNFGCAVDFTHDSDLIRAGLQPDWERENYQPLSIAAPKHGLESGFGWAFADAPHIQLPIGALKIELKDLKAAYDAGGMQAAWAFLDRFSW